MAKTNLDRPVAHGMLGASVISTTIGTKLLGDGAIWFKQSLNFHLPVRVGDLLTIRAEVIAKHTAKSSIKLKTEITSQNNQLLKRGRVKRRIYNTRDEARADLFDYIEVFYNQRRLHSAQGLLSPVDYGQQYQGRLQSV